MIEEQYYMLMGFSLTFLFLIAYFSEIEYYKTDKHGREWDASIFIVTPLCVLNIILTVVLAFQSFNIEIVDYSTNPISTFAYQQEYFAYIFMTLFFITVALLAKSVLKFFTESFEEPS